MNITLGELAEQLEAVLEGSPEVVIKGVADIASAERGHITFAENTRYFSLLKKCRASAVIVPADAPGISLPSLKVRNPRAAFAKVLALCHPPREYESGIHETAFIDEGASVSPEASVGPKVMIGSNAVIEAGAIISGGAYIGRNVRIGEKSLIHPNVTILQNTTIGSHAIVHSGAVIGSDGYGFVTVERKHHKIPQVGRVEIGNDVEIGANVTVDRGTIGVTRIGSGTKIDNLVHIAHNVTIGENCLIVAQVGISGSVNIEDNVILAGQVGVVGHLTIGRGATVAARAVVTGNVPPDSMVSGFPAKPHKEEMRIKAALRRLPRLLKYVQLRRCVADDGMPVVEDAPDNGEDDS